MNTNTIGLLLSIAILIAVWPWADRIFAAMREIKRRNRE